MNTKDQMNMGLDRVIASTIETALNRTVDALPGALNLLVEAMPADRLEGLTETEILDYGHQQVIDLIKLFRDQMLERAAKHEIGENEG